MNARRLIYEQGYAVDSKVLAKFLNTESWVPAQVSIMISYLPQQPKLGLTFISECFFQQTTILGVQFI